METGYDAIVVGGGAIGCAIAWRLALTSRRVVIFERGEVGREATYAAGGMLAPLSEADEDDDFLHLCRASLALYPRFASELATASGIDIEYRREGTLYLSLNSDDDEELDHRFAWQRSAGIDVARLTPEQTLALEPSLNPALRFALSFPDDHQVNNRRLIEALRLASVAAGVTIKAGSPVSRLLIEPIAGVPTITGVITNRGTTRSPLVIIAAGCWSSLLFETSGISPSPWRIGPVRGQMVSIRTPADRLRRVIYSRRGYLVPRLDGTIIAGSTTEHAGYDCLITPRGMATIIGNAGEMMPSFGDYPLAGTWAGLRPHTADSLPIIGPDPRIRGLLHATAHYRNGILLTPLTAELIVSLVDRGRTSLDLAPFSPGRFAVPQAAG